MIRLACSQCKSTVEADEKGSDVVYCRNCGLILRGAPPSANQNAATHQPKQPTQPSAKSTSPGLAAITKGQDAWFYVSNRQKVGPVTFQALKQRAASGQLAANDMVLPTGTQKWVSASSVPGLLPTKATPPPTSAAGQEWYYAQEGKKIGPVRLDIIQQMLVSGKLLPSSMVCKSGMQKWQPASAIPNIVLAPAAAASAGVAAPNAVAKAPSG